MDESHINSLFNILSAALYTKRGCYDVLTKLKEAQDAFNLWRLDRLPALICSERELVDEGKYIVAIKSYKGRTGADLRSAKIRVDSYRDLKRG